MLGVIIFLGVEIVILAFIGAERKIQEKFRKKLKKWYFYSLFLIKK